MKITVPYQELESTMQVVTAVVSDRTLVEDARNLIILIKDNKVRFAAYAVNTISATNVEAIVEKEDTDTFEEDGSYIALLRVKDINNILATFRSLTKTEATDVDLVIHEREALMYVHEIAIDPDAPNADKYNQVSQFHVAKPVLKSFIKKEITRLNDIPEGKVVETANLLFYIDSLYPTIAKETRESSRDMLFSDDLVYTILSSYVAITSNALPEELKGFRITNSTVNFIKNFVSNYEAFEIHKKVAETGEVTLTIKVDGSVAIITTADMSRARDIRPYTEMPSNGIVVDKSYLMDVLKRMSLSNEATTVGIKIENGVGILKVVSKTMQQEVPIFKATGEGDFVFTIKPEILSSVIFSHSAYTQDDIYLFIGETKRGTYELGVCDESKVWNTKMLGLSPFRGEFNFD